MDKSTCNVQYSTVQHIYSNVCDDITYLFPNAPLKFGNGQVISLNTWEWMQLLIRAGIKVKPCLQN